jgi:hypothetical protein
MEYTVTIREGEITEAISFWLTNERNLIPLVDASGEPKINLIYRGMDTGDPRETSSIYANCEVKSLKQGNKEKRDV